MIEPPEFIIGIQDLQPVSNLSWFLKYADDSYLVIVSRNLDAVQDELRHISLLHTYSFPRNMCVVVGAGQGFAQ